MKVKCIKIYNEHTKQYQDSCAWLTIGKEYVVLEMMVLQGKDVSYRLVGDNENEMPAIYDARQFEIVTNHLPSNWAIQQLPSDRFFFRPISWQQPGFWVNCYDGDPESLEVYKREAWIILNEENSAG
jgi:hypothetical protein